MGNVHRENVVLRQLSYPSNYLNGVWRNSFRESLIKCVKQEERLIKGNIAKAMNEQEQPTIHI